MLCPRTKGASYALSENEKGPDSVGMTVGRMSISERRRTSFELGQPDHQEATTS